MKYPELSFEPFFTWANRPRILYKAGVREELGFEMQKLGGTKVVLYTDKGLVQAGVAQMVIEAIQASSLELVGVYDKIVQDARLELINEGAAFYRKGGADCMVVVGGGSVMDTAKAINIMIGGGHEDFSPLAEQVGLFEGARPLPPHIAFPTTAGTGAEVTYAMVVLNEIARAKVAVGHPFCTPDIAMLDPELTVKLPPKITAFTAMDAMTHAIEGSTITLQETRLLAESELDAPQLFSVVFSGKPDLKKTLDEPDLFPLKRRIALRLELTGLKKDEVRPFMIARLGGAERFSDDVAMAIFERARGILAGAATMWGRALSEFGAVVILAYNPKIMPVLVYERFEGFGLRAAQPVEWYRMVTQGNMQNMMPGFAGSLTDQDILGDMLTVSDADLVRTMYFVWTRMKMVVEPTGVLGLAAVFNHRYDVKGARVGALISGGNVDIAQAAKWFENLS